jgi:glycosyltransferase involved in cell wall biosynthesis
MKLPMAMCVYTGTFYLWQQLDSIVAQYRCPPDELVVCDDGSKDTTIAILENFAAHAPFPVHIHVNYTNLGVSANFSKEIELCDGDLIAFSDQDDVWLPRKLARAEQMIHQFAHPATLYCSRLQYVNASLIPRGLLPVPSAVGFQNGIVENIAASHSVVFDLHVRCPLLQAFWQEDDVRLLGRAVFARIAQQSLEAEVRCHEELLINCSPRRYGLNEKEPFFLFRKPARSFATPENVG